MIKKLSIIWIALGLTACLGTSESSDEPTKVSKYNVNSFSMNKLVCDPFQDGVATATGGLKAKVYTMANGETPNNLDTFYNSGVMSEQDLYFSEVNVPTRIFSLGFPTLTGDIIKNDDGSDMMEWFALRMESTLKLGPNDEEGLYELALLADDGARISIKDENGNYVVAVDNDGLHPTRMGCGTTVNMTADTRLEVQLDYFQGPRWHISVIPMWRKVTDATVAESRCDQQGNHLFFDFNNNSTPQPAYNELLTRDWAPIKADNWEIPGESENAFNPCTEGEGVTISDFNVSINEDIYTFTWTTDKPATSQLMQIHTVSGTDLSLPSDNILRTEHSISVNLQASGIAVDVTAISVAEDLSKAMSQPYIFTP